MWLVRISPTKFFVEVYQRTVYAESWLNIFIYIVFTVFFSGHSCSIWYESHHYNRHPQPEFTHFLVMQDCFYFPDTAKTASTAYHYWHVGEDARSYFLCTFKSNTFACYPMNCLRPIINFPHTHSKFKTEQFLSLVSKKAFLKNDLLKIPTTKSNQGINTRLPKRVRGDRLYSYFTQSQWITNDPKIGLQRLCYTSRSHTNHIKVRHLKGIILRPLAL